MIRAALIAVVSWLVSWPAVAAASQWTAPATAPNGTVTEMTTTKL